MFSVSEEISAVKDPAAARLLREVGELEQRLEHASEEEISAACDVLTVTAARLIGLRARKHAAVPEEIEPALKQKLRRAREHAGKPMATEESVQKGEAFMEQARKEAESVLLKRIASGEWISSRELQDRLHISRQSISKAVNEGRMFAVVGPAGANYYPAFYALEKYSRRSIERIAKQLGTLPATVKYHFFTSKAFSLGGKTPLEALEEGRVDDVLRAAIALNQR